MFMENLDVFGVGIVRPSILLFLDGCSEVANGSSASSSLAVSYASRLSADRAMYWVIKYGGLVVFPPGPYLEVLSPREVHGDKEYGHDEHGFAPRWQPPHAPTVPLWLLCRYCEAPERHCGSRDGGDPVGKDCGRVVDERSCIKKLVVCMRWVLLYLYECHATHSFELAEGWTAAIRLPDALSTFSRTLPSIRRESRQAGTGVADGGEVAVLRQGSSKGWPDSFEL